MAEKELTAFEKCSALHRGEPVKIEQCITQSGKEMLEEDAKVSTIDRLIANAPESIDEHTLHRLRQAYDSAIKRAESCEIKEMVSNLLLFEDAHGEIVDEMAWALRKDILQSKDYDAYVRLLGLFERRTLPIAIEKILLEECKCGSK